jgi:phage terminase small subunit
MQKQAMDAARQLAAELGLTPISRSRPLMRDLFDRPGDDDPLNIS